MQMSLTCSANNIHKNDLKCASSKRKAFKQIHTIAYIYIHMYIPEMRTDVCIYKISTF